MRAPSPSRRRCLVPLVLLLPLAGCAGGEEGAGPDLPRLPTTEVMTYGDPEGDGILSLPFDVDVGSDGQVFVSEPQLGHVQVFGPDGAWVRTLGRKGDGPGEFQVPGNLAWTGDTLVVVDFQHGMSLFTLDGTYQGRITVRLPAGDSPFPTSPVFLLADGNTLAITPTPVRLIAQGVATSEYYFNVSRTGDLLDTVMALSVAGRSAEVEADGRSRYLTPPLADHTLPAVAPDGSFVVATDRAIPGSPDAPSAVVHRIAPSGDTLVSRAFSFEPVPVTAAQVDSLARVVSAGWVSPEGLTAAAAADVARGGLDWPDRWPAVSEVQAATDGSVWLRREHPTGDSIRWDVLDARLEPVGFTRLPADVEVKVVVPEGGGWSVYGLRRDALDIPSVIQLRVGNGG